MTEKLVLFDWDGTVIDSQPSAWTSLHFGLQQMATYLNTKRLTNEFLQSSLAATRGTTERNLALHVIQSLADSHSINSPKAEEIEEALQIFYELRAWYLMNLISRSQTLEPVATKETEMGDPDLVLSEHSIIPGALAFVRGLADAGIAFGLVTGNPQLVMDFRMLQSLWKLFLVDGIQLKGAFGDERNTRADLIRLATQRLAEGCSMDQVIMVGDTLADRAAAQEVGCRFIGVAQHGSELRKVPGGKNELLIHDFTDPALWRWIGI